MAGSQYDSLIDWLVEPLVNAHFGVADAVGEPLRVEVCDRDGTPRFSAEAIVFSGRQEDPELVADGGTATARYSTRTRAVRFQRRHLKEDPVVDQRVRLPGDETTWKIKRITEDTPTAVAIEVEQAIKHNRKHHRQVS